MVTETNVSTVNDVLTFDFGIQDQFYCFYRQNSENNNI